ncbi:hypothetical protein [Flavobacterium sp. 102]|uniref:hypothetical protein n=1 Tax=Flavobacterium sp. 102 TaxID=2135623 RepID=UPI000EAEDFE2|nr:hypothetical protein [Flavobacterium sp. 102]RKS03014.1 hypothetical protein C8C84_2754 [Flavobacterium sp. 102]
MKTIEHFWSWFSGHQSKLKNLITLSAKEKKYYVYWLDWHLHFYAPGVDFILIFPNRKNEKTKMIISANGNPDFFTKVEEVIKPAPKFKDWEFKAFVQPSKDIDEMEAGLDKPYIFKDINLKASELKFIPFEYEDSKKIDMIVYLKNFTVHCNNKNLLEAVFIIMQDIIGEKSLYKNINFVELAQMPEDDNIELIYLYDLQCYLDEINTK